MSYRYNVLMEWYDYGARFYMPDLGRFLTQDRFAEKYHDMTLYQYGANNPIRYIDVNGDSISVSKDFQNNKLAASALCAILSTKLGKAYFAKYAAKNDKISVGGKTFTFDSDGKYSKSGIDLSFNVGKLINQKSGETQSNESKGDNGLDLSIVIDPKTTKDVFSTAETIVHEGFLESDYLAKDFANDGKLDYNNISNYVKNDWFKGNRSHYNHGQNYVDRSRVGGENLMWPGRGYRVLQDVNKILNSGLNNQQIQNKMYDSSGIYGPLFGKFKR